MPTPRKNRPGSIVAAVAAAWATIAGWMRMVGHVTPVPTRMRSVRAAMPPRTPHTNGLCPWRSIQGWKWSETRANVEAGLLGARGVVHEVEGRVLLARECVAELHVRLLPSRPGVRPPRRTWSTGIDASFPMLGAPQTSRLRRCDGKASGPR